MDLQDQLKSLFPDHEFSEDKNKAETTQRGLWVQETPLRCKFEKRHGKATVIIEGYTGDKEDFKRLAKEIKTELGVGGSIKDETIILQGDFRPQIMQILREYGFKVKPVGG